MAARSLGTDLTSLSQSIEKRPRTEQEKPWSENAKTVYRLPEIVKLQ